ncbi:MAG: hypothetical protein ACRDZ8_00370, partial [Acidimicrobiales bacterium]
GDSVATKDIGADALPTSTGAPAAGTEVAGAPPGAGTVADDRSTMPIPPVARRRPGWRGYGSAGTTAPSQAGTTAPSQAATTAPSQAATTALSVAPSAAPPVAPPGESPAEAPPFGVPPPVEPTPPTSPGYLSPWAVPGESAPAPPGAEPTSYDFAPTTKPGRPPKVPRAERPPRRPFTLTPHINKGPERSTLIAVGIILIGLVIIAIVAGFLANGYSSSIGGPPPPAGDACNLVTSDQASAVFGVSAGRANFVLGECVYEDINGTHELLVQDYHQGEQAVYNATHTSDAVAVPGIGDMAYYVGGSLWVVSGKNIMEITLVVMPNNPTAAPASPPPGELTLAREALPKL